MRCWNISLFKYTRSGNNFPSSGIRQRSSLGEFRINEEPEARGGNTYESNDCHYRFISVEPGHG